VHPRITAIAASPRHPQRASIKVDGKWVATLTHALIDELNLTVGQAWDDRLEQRVAEAAAYDKALRGAMRRLDRRAMSTRQLADKLKTLGYSQPVIDRVIGRITELGVLDDEAYGQALIREVQRGKPAGPRLLRVKLVQKGLDRRLIDELVASATDDDGVSKARQFAQTKLGTLMRYDVATRKRRLWGLLARRGFEREVIDDVLSNLPGLADEE
jgi:regulatory protein